ncbi:MAG TPA: radical SAM protein [Candidatus Limnocylindrales bacterium]|nr:radical SAM protein [Candidatus Limnocylindrales bacterium]
MTRVVLINPPSPERLGAPLLGLQYVAAALLGRGCDVTVIDAAARSFEGSHELIAQAVIDLEPDIVGMGLFTRWVWHAYRLVDVLRETVLVDGPATAPGGRSRKRPLFVAGGAHTTVRPLEPLARGFDVAVSGEAEETILDLVDVVEGHRALHTVPGLHVRAADGSFHHTGPRGFVESLDTLAWPQRAQALFDARWYGAAGTAAPGGMLTSRGCPARCTFCANYVTGRGFRYRSASDVAAELNAYHASGGATFYPFWDDALTARRDHLESLCEALRRDVAFPLGWSAITRASMVTFEMLRTMRDAGCVAVNFGVESGDDRILRAIKKGITTATVVRALEWAKELGLTTACNFMLGFPQEEPEHVEHTLRFMERIAPMVDAFSTLGVLIPFPGTPLYEEYHAGYGFTDWWLEERYSKRCEPPPLGDRAAYHRYYLDDASLELDFFRYTPQMRSLIRQCLRFKGEHNLRRMGQLPAPVAA